MKASCRAAIGALSSLVGFVGTSRGEDVQLAQDGRSTFSIVVSSSASPSERRGADELRSHLKKMSGADLPIVTDEEPLPARAILVGRSRQTDAIGVKADLKDLGLEGFLLKTQDGHVIVLGSPVRGTMYGCTTLLEKLGVRWFTPTVTHIPKRKTVTLGPLDEVHKPDFEYRDTDITEAANKDWAARLKLNGFFPQLDDSTGGKVTYYKSKIPWVNWVHTLSGIIPDPLLAEHPEYFPLVKGKRVSGRNVQRCLSNPEVLRIAIGKVREWMKDDPGATIFSVSQNDHFGFCECENCRAIEAKYGGAHSGLILWFVNQVADAVAKEHPDKLIDTLAYLYSEPPPRGIKPRRNVRVRLCPMGACEAHPYERCSDKPTAEFVKSLMAWSKLTDSLYIWHYCSDFPHCPLPFPDFGQLPTSVRLYKEHGVKGVFFEGDNTAGPGTGDRELHAYVLAKLSWDHEQDANALINEWMAGVYGPAAKPLRRWFDLLQERAAVPDKHIHVYDDPPPHVFSADVIAAGDRAFDEAEKLAARNPVARRYVFKARMGLRYVKLMRDPTIGPEFRSFVADAWKLGLANIGGGTPLERWERKYRKRLGDDSPPSPPADQGEPPSSLPHLNALTDAQKAAGWRLLFDGQSTEGWRGYQKPGVPDGWRAIDGVLRCFDSSSGDLVTAEEFGDFELQLDYKVTPGSNSGIIFRVSENRPTPWMSGIEYQVEDDGNPSGDPFKSGTASGLYELPTDPKTHRPIGPSRPAGSWNHVRIVCRGPHVEHWLNSAKICEYEIGSADWNRRVAQTDRVEFPRFGRNRSGHIALQAQSGSISFANIRLLPLPAKAGR